MHNRSIYDVPLRYVVYFSKDKKVLARTFTHNNRLNIFIVIFQFHKRIAFIRPNFIHLNIQSWVKEIRLDAAV